MSQAVAELEMPVRRYSFLTDFFIRMVKEKPLGTVGLVIFLLLLLAGIFANFLAPYGLNETVGGFLKPPSGQFWLGTDNLGGTCSVG